MGVYSMTARDPKTGRFPKGSGIPANGPGWGGAAKGEGTKERFSDENQPPGEVKSAGHAEGKALREMLAPHKAELVNTWLAILKDPTQPAAARVAAANAIADRLEGKPSQGIGGADDLGPIKTVVAWEDGE
jgi:hypothetical protein